MKECYYIEILLTIHYMNTCLLKKPGYSFAHLQSLSIWWLKLNLLFTRFGKPRLQGASTASLHCPNSRRCYDAVFRSGPHPGCSPPMTPLTSSLSRWISFLDCSGGTKFDLFSFWHALRSRRCCSLDFWVARVLRSLSRQWSFEVQLLKNQYKFARAHHITQLSGRSADVRHLFWSRNSFVNCNG